MNALPKVPVILKSRQVNLDPTPYHVAETDSWHSEAAVRASADSDNDIIWQLAIHRPRAWFEATRDPKPYVDSAGFRYSSPKNGGPAHHSLTWSPRRAWFDHPVSPILSAFRWARAASGLVPVGAHAAHFLASAQQMGVAMGLPQQHIDHAIEVLRRIESVSRLDARQIVGAR